MIQRFDAPSTEKLLPFDLLVGELERAVAEYTAGTITSPERLVTPLAAGGVMLSMPASAQDIAIHKLVSVCPSNFSCNLPTINGEVVAYDAVTGIALFALDGPAVTGRRTAAVTLSAINRLRKAPPKTIAIIGTGKQASTHVQALSSYFPGVDLVVAGISQQEEEQFCARHSSCSAKPFADRDWSRIDVVITLTTSKTPVYVEAAVRDRLIVGVGAFTPDAAEVGRQTVLAIPLSSTIPPARAMRPETLFWPASIGPVCSPLATCSRVQPILKGQCFSRALVAPPGILPLAAWHAR